MKRSWKGRIVSPDRVREAFAVHDTVTAAAQALGIARETLQRWLKRPEYASARRPITPATSAAPAIETLADPGTVPPMSSAAFGTWARQMFTFNPAEDAILRLAEQSLQLAEDTTAAPRDPLGRRSKFPQRVTRRRTLYPPSRVIIDSRSDKERALWRSARRAHLARIYADDLRVIG